MWKPEILIDVLYKISLRTRQKHSLPFVLVYYMLPYYMVLGKVKYCIKQLKDREQEIYYCFLLGGRKQ
jgi:hypothetical protein